MKNRHRRWSILLPVIMIGALLNSGCGRSPAGTLVSGDIFAGIDRQQASYSRLQLGLAYLAQGELSAARVNLERAEQYAPADYRPKLGMALYAQRAGNPAIAEEYYQQALRLAAGKGGILNNYGAFLCTLGHYKQAQQHFTAAIQAEDHNQPADIFENSGYCFLQAGQLSEARGMLIQAVNKAPGKGSRLITKAGRLFEQGDYPRSRMLLELYEQILPVSAQSLRLQIRFAALDGSQSDIERYGNQLAHDFPQSRQYQQFLANEY